MRFELILGSHDGCLLVWFGFGLVNESESEGEGLAFCSFIWKTQLGLT
jgi:hypothetical protein